MRKNLLKMSLIAIGMVVGTMGAWADDTYTEVYSRTSTAGASNAWSDNDIADWGGNSNLTSSYKDKEGVVHGLFGFDVNQTCSAEKEFTVAANSKIKYEVSWYMGSSTANNANFSYIQFGDNLRFSWGNYYCMYLNTDGTSSRTTQIGSKGSNTTYTKKIEVIYNSATSSIEKVVFDGVDLTESVGENLNGNFNKVSFGFIRGGRVNWTVPNRINSITVSECKQDVPTVNYTLNYKFNENTIKTISGTGMVGAEISVPSVVYDDANERYLTKESAPVITLKESGNDVTLDVRKPYSAQLNVETIVGGESLGTKNITLVETDDRTTDWSYVYSLYTKKGDKYYIVDNSASFGEKGTFNDGEVINKTISYTKEASDVIFFAEAESNSGENLNYSNGADGVVTAQNKRNRGIKVGLLQAGTYQFRGVITGKNGRSVVIREYIATGDEDIKNSTVYASLNSGEQNIEFTIDKETDFIINGANSGNDKTNQSENFDYVLVKRVLPATETIAVSSAQYATYATSYNLTVPSDENVKVYTVKVNAEGTAIEKTAIAAGTVIPAGTGILVNGAEGSYDFAVTSDEAATMENNDLVAATANVTSDGATYYALAMKNGKVGFSLVAEGVVIPAGKAYLKVSEASGAKFISMDGELTGIDNVKTEAASERDAYYTLQGLKTAKPAKGLYIHNGKTVIIK